MNTRALVFSFLLCLCPVAAMAAGPCAGIDPSAASSSTPDTEDSGACHTRLSHGYPVPDKGCTPGAVNPTVTANTLRTEGFTTTACMRNNATTEAQKKKTYIWYALMKPPQNTGAAQLCELDHLVPLSLGGADTLNNIWPQCGPKGVVRAERFFAQKDLVECFMRAKVLAGASDMELKRMQREISVDWTVSLAAAKKFWDSHPGAKKCKGA